MLKRTLWTILLSCQLCLAAPLPQLDKLDQPGVYLSARERTQLLLDAEKLCRQRGNVEGLVEIECLRVAKLTSGDPTFPARLTALRARLPELNPGPARARIYWLARYYAMRTGDRLSEDKFEELALAEPNLPPVLKARWLAESSRPDKVEAHLKALSALYHSHPSSQVQWYWLDLQQRAQRGKDLEFSLALARLQLAEKEGWLYEQFVALRRLRWLPNGESYAARWSAFVFSLKASPLRDEMILGLSRDTIDRKEVERLLNQLQTPLSALKRMEELFRSRTGMSQEERARGLLKLIDAYRKERNVEQEIRSRVELANARNNVGKIGEAVQQCRAARQLRLDHPAPDPAWATDNLGALTQTLARYLTTQGFRHQALDLLEEALASGQAPRAYDRSWMHRDCLQLAKESGDVAAVERHWLALVDLAPQLPQERIGWTYRELYEQAPPSQAGRRPQLLSQARKWAEATLEADLQGNYSSGLQGDTLLAMILREQGDRPGELAIWRKVLDKGRREGDRNLIESGRTQLMYAYGNNGEIRSEEDRREFTQIVRNALQDPSLEANPRHHYLDWALQLARYGEPETLAWADEYVRLSTRDAEQKARAIRRRAQVQMNFKRYQAALASMDEAATLSPTRPGDWVERQRAEILWAAARKQEALAVLRADRDRVLASELPFFAVIDVRKLAEYQEALEQDWQAEYAFLLGRFEALGEVGATGRNATLFDWLKRLAELQQWDRGREVLQQHPWRGSALEKNTQQLQGYPAWADLLPAKAEAPVEKPDSLSQVLDELRLGRPDLGQLISLRSTNLKHLQSRLGANDTLVTYCSFGNQFYVLGLRAEGGFYRKSALDAGQLQALGQRYLSSLNADSRSEAEATLYSLLVEPVLAERPEQRLYLVPTGGLWELPFGALRDRQGRSLAAQAEVVLLSSGDLLRLADNDWKPYRLSQPLAIGAPPGADLPGAYQELEEVARLLPDCQLRRGAQATTDVLYQPGRQWGLLHFASHAHYRLDQPTESDIQLHDGDLKLKQLSQLSLAEHSLVALSCCQGGATGGQRLDEPVTLATGVSAAGAGTVVANLWKVDDEVARTFFASFYRELAAGDSPGRSFRSAQAECRKAYPNPRDWAGFFLLGNPT